MNICDLKSNPDLRALRIMLHLLYRILYENEVACFRCIRGSIYFEIVFGRKYHIKMFEGKHPFTEDAILTTRAVSSNSLYTALDALEQAICSDKIKITLNRYKNIDLAGILLNNYLLRNTFWGKWEELCLSRSEHSMYLDIEIQQQNTAIKRKIRVPLKSKLSSAMKGLYSTFNKL